MLYRFSPLAIVVCLALLTCLCSPAIASNHSVGWVKTLANGATLSEPLTDKVVTAVLPTSTGNGIDCIYIQEPQGTGMMGGVKVIASSYPSGLTTGNQVSVEGVIFVDINGECCIAASNITITGTAVIPRPILIVNRAMACTQSGLQPSLSYKPTAVPPAMPIRGLSAVGMRVKVFGKITWIKNDRTECVISDGSKIWPGVGDSVLKGVRVLYPAGHTCPDAFGVGYIMAEGLVGVIGAEKIGDVSVPVLRVPSSVVYVKPLGSDYNDGLSWGSALQTVQAGINAATLTQPKSEVWVMGDSEFPYIEALTLADGVAVYGGFAGIETARDARDPLLHRSILYPLEAITAVGCGHATHFDGFYVSGASGGAFYCENSSVVIANNEFQDNWYSDKGGAIYCVGGAPLIENNQFINNRANSYEPGDGGSIYCEDSFAVISRNTITGSNDGSARRYGGGICCKGGAPVIQGNTISGHTVDSGGAIYCDSLGARIASNVLYNNRCISGNGGGIFIASGMPNVYNNTIRNNNASFGGGIYVASGSPILANNIVAYCSTGIACGVATPTIFNNNVYGNDSADYVGLPQGIGSMYGNISVSPGFLEDGFHIQPESECVGKGENSVVQTNDYDIDGEVRIRPVNGRVDIGADETTNCGWHVALAAPLNGGQVGQSVNITACVTDDFGAVVPGVMVHFSIQEGTALLDPVSDSTDTSGVAHTNVTSMAGGWTTIRAYLTDLCGGELASIVKARFYDPNAPADVVFVLDRSGSMAGHEASYPSDGSVQALVHTLSAAKPNTRFGAVMFDESTAIRSISMFNGETAVNDFCTWLGTFGANGGTSAQVTALNAACADLESNSPSTHRRFIIFLSDDLISGQSLVAREQLVARLDAVTGLSDGGVFISLWELWQGSMYSKYSHGFTGDPAYPSLAVNGGFDPTSYPSTSPTSGRYPFTNVAARIMQGL